MSFPPLVFTHLHKCAGSSLRQMLFRKFKGVIEQDRMHVPEITCDVFGNLPMMEERGEELPSNLLLLADHSPCGLYDDRVLAPGKPFRVTLLRSPLDRLESYYNFCARSDLLPQGWASYTADMAAMPEGTLIELCRLFERTSGYVSWFDPLTRDLTTALRNLLHYDVIARHDDLIGFCARFNASNPYGLQFCAEEVVHLNQSEHPCRMSATQRGIAARVLANDGAIWGSPEVQRALAGAT